MPGEECFLLLLGNIGLTPAQSLSRPGMAAVNAARAGAPSSGEG